MSDHRILVTGAAGMVGSYVPRVFPNEDLLLTDIVGDLERLDVRDRVGVEETVRRYRPFIVLHLAAATDVDQCERDPDWAFHTNAVGTGNVARACKQADALLVYVSTAAVFSGEKHDPYTEFDTPSPVNIYAMAKLAGEQEIMNLLDRFYIVRAGWMFGGGALDKKFVGKIAELILKGQKSLRVVSDKLGTPTYALDLLEGIEGLLKSQYFGLFHMGNEGVCSRLDMACVIAETLGAGEVELVPVASAYFPLPAPRGRSEAISNYKMKLLGYPPLRPWRDALREYVEAELLPALTAGGIGT